MLDHRHGVIDWLLPISVGVTIFGVGSFLYNLFKDEDEEDVRTGPIYAVNSASVEIRVPKFSVGNVVGRHGHRIREIQIISNTRMFFREPKRVSDLKVCVIRGLPENVEIAEKHVYNAILWYPEVNTVEIFIPTRTCCVLVSRYGDSIRWVRRLTRCKIIVDNWCFHNNYSTRRIFIKGSEDQIERAKSFFAEKVEEDEPPPATPSGVLPVVARRRMTNADPEEEDFAIDMDVLFKTGNNGLLEVFVAAVENPEKFWVQIMGPSILTLDKLTEEMTDFYEKPSNRRKYALKDVTVGQHIAVPFQYDNKWYRGEVLRIIPNKVSDRDTTLEVFYLDHGDIGTYRKREVFELMEQFSELRHQAIRCILANVQPSGGAWCEESIEFFKNLTTVGLWKTVSAKVVDYRSPPYPHDPPFRKKLPIPCLQLVDTTHPVYLDVASELVDKGYAVWLEDNKTIEAIP